MLIQCCLLGRIGDVYGTKELVQEYEMHRRTAQYWVKRYRSGDYPRPRHIFLREKFTPSEMLQIEYHVQHYVQQHEHIVDRKALAKYVSDVTGFDVTVYFINTIFKKWHWSFKKPVRMNKNKFSFENISNYIDFVVWVHAQQPDKLKFLDESHFELRRM